MKRDKEDLWVIYSFATWFILTPIVCFAVNVAQLDIAEMPVFGALTRLFYWGLSKDISVISKLSPDNYYFYAGSMPAAILVTQLCFIFNSLIVVKKIFSSKEQYKNIDLPVFFSSVIMVALTSVPFVGNFEGETPLQAWGSGSGGRFAVGPSPFAFFFYWFFLFGFLFFASAAVSICAVLVRRAVIRSQNQTIGGQDG